MTLNPLENGLYPISTVASLTGVNAVTLRAWERRYGLVKPIRTESGHRLYTEADVTNIKTILHLLDEGIAISRVPEAMRQAEQRSQDSVEATGPWARYQSLMLSAVENFDEGILDSLYNEAMSLYPVDVVTQHLLIPLIKSLGDRWTKESAGIAEEHFFSVFMRNKLGARFHHRNLQNTGPRIIAACLPGELHEFGLLLFTLSAHARGYRIVLLGADMPLLQLAEVLRRTDSDAIVLSGSVEAVKQDLDKSLGALVKVCKVPVFIGGTYAQRRRQALVDLGAIPLADDLIVGLHTIGKQLLKNSPR